ncbi:MAG: hypothetical protein HYU97_00200 [Deltaproteobacteria bacterium]|nr:hypothetical protein [Deltaproteobacteria bacterium]
MTWLALAIFIFILAGCGGGASPPAGIPAPVSSAITVTAPNENGFVTITGAAGAVPGSATVTAGNVNNGAVVRWFEKPFVSVAHALVQDSVVANADGSFVITTVEAQVGHTIRLRYTLNSFISETTDKIVPNNVLLLDSALTPRYADIHRATNIGYVTSGDGINGQIFQVDVTGLALLTTLTINNESDIQAIAVDEVNNVAMVINDSTDNLTPIDLTGPTVQAAVNIANNPQNLAVSPAGGYAVVGLRDTNSLSIFNTATLAVDCTYQITDGVLGATHVSTPFLQIDNDGANDIVVSLSQFDNNSYLVTRSRVDGCAAVPPLVTLQQVPVNIGNPGGFAVYNNGIDVFISDRDGDHVVRVNMSTAATTDIDVGDDPIGIVVNSNNNQAYVINSGGNSISQIDLNSNAATTFLDPVGLSATQFGFNASNDAAILASPTDHTAVILQLN